MRRAISTVSVAILFSALALVSAAAARRSTLDISSIAGVYKRSYANALVSGETYTSENILEIVRLGPSSAYVRAHIEGFNGHSCGIYGVARPEGGALVYRDRTGSNPGATCVFKIEPHGRTLELSDGGTCRDTCGMRAKYDGTAFDIDGRRPIRYMSRLKASRQYTEALARDK